MIMQTQEEWQNYCSDFLVKGRNKSPRHETKLLIYKDSIDSIHINALKISFPVLLQLIGESSFIKLSKSFIEYKQWQSESLDDFGYDFDQFISLNPMVQSINYLPEVARLEWLIQSLSEKQNNDARLMLQLQELLESGHEFSATLLPHINYFESTQGAMDIWIAHQKSSFEQLNLMEIEVSYWCIQNDSEVVSVEKITELDFTFLSELKHKTHRQKSVLALCNKFGTERVVQYLIELIETKSISFELFEFGE